MHGQHTVTARALPVAVHKKFYLMKKIEHIDYKILFEYWITTLRCLWFASQKTVAHFAMLSFAMFFASSGSLALLDSTLRCLDQFAINVSARQGSPPWPFRTLLTGRSARDDDYLSYVIAKNLARDDDFFLTSLRENRSNHYKFSKSAKLKGNLLPVAIQKNISKLKPKTYE